MPSVYRDAVAQFHRAVGVEQCFPAAPRQAQLIMVALRATLIEEETREFTEALSTYEADKTPEHFQHLAKELADLLYVLAGTADVLNTPLQDIQPHLAGANSLAGLVLCAHSRIVVQELTDLGRLIHAEEHPADIQDQVDGLASDLQQFALWVSVVAAVYGIPLRAVFDAVHGSNMSKMDPATGQPKFRADGKVVKGPWYRGPDLSFLAKTAA